MTWIDKVAPEYSTTLETKTVHSSKYGFILTYSDNVKISESLVMVNGNTVEASAPGQYEIMLEEGKNDISFVITDTAGNKVSNAYIVTFDMQTTPSPAIKVSTKELTNKKCNVHS